MPPPPKPFSPLPPAPPPVLTPFAHKYGISPTRALFNGLLNPAFPTIQKSLYTPILPLHPNANANEKYRAEKTLNLQRYRLKGLTTLTLIDNEIISEKAMKKATLSCPVHPLLARRRWRTVLAGHIQYPLIDGNGVTRGTWDLEKNDLAWQAMLPSIRLASMVLNHLHTHPWLDTLLLGNEEPLDPFRFPAYDLQNPTASTAQHHKVMRVRVPGPRNASECASAFSELQKWRSLHDLTLGMVSSDKGPDGVLHRDNALVNGFASWADSPTGERCAIYISYERAALLLSRQGIKMSESDRLCLQLLIANTIVHEVMHAIGNAKRHREQVMAGGVDGYPFLMEPYFEDEVVAELGSSMDDAVWGGSLIGVADSEVDEIVPIGYGVLKGPQPILSSAPTLLSPPLPKLDVYRPIQVTYYEMIQQFDFWNSNVRNFAHFRPGPIVLNGTSANLISTRDRGPSGLWQVVKNMPDYNDAMIPPNKATYMINKILVMTGADRVNYVANQKKKEVLMIYKKLLMFRIEQTEGIWDQVEMLTRGDITRGGFSVAQGIGSTMGAISEVLGTETKLLLALSAFDKTSETHIRGIKDAQSFNRGLRSLLGDIAEASTVLMVPELAEMANMLSEIVENARVILTVSPNLPNGISIEDDIILAQQDEANCIQRIEDARLLLGQGDHETSNKICEEVSTSMSSTLLTKCAARILMCYSHRKDYNVRLNVVSRAIQTLQRTPAPNGREVEQARVLGLALQLQARLVNGDLSQQSNSTGVFMP
ncbi:hypothetical protein WAI453_003301 [Rhynchosporium graminicola]